MSQRRAAKDFDDEQDNGVAPSRPARMRTAKKRPPRTRKTRRKQVKTNTNGIHRRANKRTNW
jgi:hypothetical protein